LSLGSTAPILKAEEVDMRKLRQLSPLLTSLLIVGGLAPLAASAQSSWYVGASLGQSAIKASPGEVESGFLLDDGFTASGTFASRRMVKRQVVSLTTVQPVASRGTMRCSRSRCTSVSYTSAQMLSVSPR
jgi:hypothetical protein